MQVRRGSRRGPKHLQRLAVATCVRTRMGASIRHVVERVGHAAGGSEVKPAETKMGRYNREGRGERGGGAKGGRQEWRAKSPVFSLYGRFSHSSGERYNGVPKNVVSMTVSALFTRPTPKSPT